MKSNKIPRICLRCGDTVWLTCWECDDLLDDADGEYFIVTGERVCKDCYNEWLKENEL